MGVWSPGAGDSGPASKKTAEHRSLAHRKQSLRPKAEALTVPVTTLNAAPCSDSWKGPRGAKRSSAFEGRGKQTSKEVQEEGPQNGDQIRAADTYYPGQTLL